MYLLKENNLCLKQENEHIVTQGEFSKILKEKLPAT
jgi:hypothetical protein